MYRRVLVFRAALAFALPAVLAWGPTAAQAASVTGSGRVVNEARQVGPFEAIALRGSIDLVLRQSGREAVEVRADDNLLALIETVVVEQGGVRTLEIRPARHADWSTRSETTVTVDLVKLGALAIAGSGDVRADALKTGTLKLAMSGSGDMQLRQLSADELAVKMAGSGDIEAAGRVGRLTVSAAGSGDVKARALEVDDATVSIAGSGDANLNVRRTLTVSIAGSGDVSYVGDAVVKSSVAGSGTVRKR
jgi:hypothetical protein